MTDTLTRTGGCTAFRVEGKVPDYRDQDFADKLREQRFRTIENAASEETSVGWVTPADPSGETFSVEDVDAGIEGAWLRFRIDKKALPAKWLRMRVAASERARGRRLSAKERRELKDELMEELLPRVLPTVTFVDALVTRDRVLLFSTTNGAREAFASLWWHSFGTNLIALDPRGLADEVLAPDMAARCDKAEPTRWPRRTGGES